QEIRGHPHPWDEPVGHRNNRRAPSTSAQRYVVEAQVKSAVDRNRAAKAHTAIHREVNPALEQKAHDLQEILVPANGNAVFGDAPKPSHHPVVEPFDEAHDIADGLEWPAARVLRDPG